MRRSSPVAGMYWTTPVAVSHLEPRSACKSSDSIDFFLRLDSAWSQHPGGVAWPPPLASPFQLPFLPIVFGVTSADATIDVSYPSCIGKVRFL